MGPNPDETSENLPTAGTDLRNPGESQDVTASDLASVQALHDRVITDLYDEISDLLADALLTRHSLEAEAELARRIHDGELAGLRDEIASLLTGAAEMAERSAADAEQTRLAHEEALGHLTAALESRDLLGQAKGIIMASMQCSADEAWELIVAQSQAENRKVTEIASAITARTSARSGDPASESSS